MEVLIKRSSKFGLLYDLPQGTEFVILMGGRGGGKTYEASKYVAYSSTISGKRCQVLRDEKEGIKESILNEVLLRFDTANKDGVFNSKFARLDNGIKNLKTGEMVVFTKGFRASALDKKANLKSVSNVDIAVIEEGEDIRDEDRFNTFADSIRKEGSVIIFILNTPDIHHWIVKRYFNAIPLTREDEPDMLEEDLDGFFKLEPKGVEGVVSIISNFRDNEFLPEKVVNRYLSYSDPTSHMYNPYHYLTAIQGYSTTGLRGQIFKNYDIIEAEEFASIDYQEIYGLDFGTASPAGLVGVKVVGNDVYVRELNYEPLSLVPLGYKLDTLGIKESDLIIADCAEPTTILELRIGLARYMNEGERERYPTAARGFGNIRPSPDKSIKAGIDKLLSMKIHVTRESVNLIKELTLYVWALDKDSKPTGYPIDNWNHLVDGLRYIIRVHGLWY